MQNDFKNLISDFHAHFTSDASRRLKCGLFNDLGELPDPSAEAAEAWNTVSVELLERFDAFDTASVDFDAALDVDLARLMLRAEINRHTYRFNNQPELAQQPQAGPAIGDGIFLLFINDPRPDAERLDDIVGRLKAVPEFLDKMLSRLNTPVARWVEMDVEVVQGLPALFENISVWAAETNYPRREALATARDAAESALERYLTKLKAMPTTTNFHVGDAVARSIVALRGIDMSLEALHEMATEFLATTRETIEGLRAKLVAKYELPDDTDAEALQVFLAKKYRIELPTGDVNDILDAYLQVRDDITDFIGQHDLFPILADQDMNIIRTPAFMAPTIPAGAMLPPPAFREGTRTSMVYLTLGEELVDEHTALSIPSMMVHEGIPGHHLQLATASTHKSVIRRHVEANDHAEGWTTMLEDYMLDVGYMAELADEVRFCGKRDLSRIGARVAIDLFFMTGDKKYLDIGVACDLSSDDPFEAAGNLLQAVTGFVPERVQSELNWYSQERGYPLSYLTGNTIVWALKAELEATQAGKLEGRDLDRRFHEVYLHSGNMPLTFLRRVLVHEGLLIP